jgi:hypothetical protein
VQIRILRQLDLKAVEALLHPGFKLGPSLRRALPAIWSGWLDEGMLMGSGVVDVSVPGQERVLLASLTAFVHDWFLEELQRYPTAHLAERIYDLHSRDYCPLLSAREIAEQNRPERGLNQVLLHWALENYDYTSPAVTRLLRVGRDAYRFAHVGFQYRSFTFGAHGSHQRDFLLRIGMDLIASDAGRDGKDAYTLQSTRDKLYNGGFLSYFYWAPPSRFLFTPTEQSVLTYAMLNQTDEEIAGSLSISGETVRKLWRSVFQRVTAIDAAFIGETVSEARGAEKRRHLIHYLHSHLEELRPRARRRAVSGRGGQET